MPKLILSMDGLVLKEITLAKERTTVGRKPTNDIQIDNLSISGEHAAITYILGDAFLEDLNSTNGTYVNGQPIKKHLLQNNDVVDLGKYRLKFIADVEKDNTAQLDAIPYEVDDLDPGEFTTDMGSTEQQSTTQMIPTEVAKALLDKPAEGHHPGMIRLMSGTQAGRELTLSKPLTRLGKPGKQVAAINRRGDSYYITHLEGETPPQVNGQPVSAQPRKLEEHDVIEIAGIQMEFFMRK